MGKMLVLTPNQVREVCKKKEEERKKKEVRRIQKIQRHKRQLATSENMRVLESKLGKLELAEKQYLLSLWMKYTRQSQNLANDPKNLIYLRSS
jgi:hypothetical protein